MAILEVNDLTVSFGSTQILRGVTFGVEEGKTLGVVGESGCGKSMTSLALMGMVPKPGKATSGSIKLAGRELLGLKESEWRKVRGSKIALVMQDPFTSLNPMMTVGSQIAESLIVHRGIKGRKAWDRAVELLHQVGVPVPEASASKYPHQMSGGQRQRVVIAIAFACQPELLIADEPTTALDVTLQAQILRLLRELQEREGTAVIFISHDIQAVGSIAHDVAVFYAGRVVEMGSAEQVLRTPAMPYTKALLKAMPRKDQERLEVIPGMPPQFASLGTGCSFAPRCPYKIDRCAEEPGMITLGDGHCAACWRAKELMGAASDVTSSGEAVC